MRYGKRGRALSLVRSSTNSMASLYYPSLHSQITHRWSNFGGEQYEAFNGTLAKVKRLFGCMPGTVQRVELTNARTQGNLKGDILDEKLAILKSIQGSKRGTQKS